jgi:hypothetical protein
MSPSCTTALRSPLLAVALTLSVAGCTVGDDSVDAPEEDVAFADPGWVTRATAHVGDHMIDQVLTGNRNVHGLWINGTSASPIKLVVNVDGMSDDDWVRVAVLSPVNADGSRTTVSYSGYYTKLHHAKVSVALARTGQYLLVAGSYQLATTAAYQIAVHCAANAGTACGGARVDALKAPKVGGLVGTIQTDGKHIMRAWQGAAIGTSPMTVEAWASRPMLGWAATKVASAISVDGVALLTIPSSVVKGDDIRLMVKRSGTTLDSGVNVRWSPGPISAYARLDAILYGDLVSVSVAGVVPYFEAVADMALQFADDGTVIDDVPVYADRPGQKTNGLSSFDVTFNPPLTGPDGELNPDLPRDGDLLEVGWNGADGLFHSLGCFEYCNDLAGTGDCTGGPRTCP